MYLRLERDWLALGSSLFALFFVSEWDNTPWFRHGDDAVQDGLEPTVDVSDEVRKDLNPLMFLVIAQQLSLGTHLPTYFLGTGPCGGC